MSKPRQFPAETQRDQPGDEYKMSVKPEVVQSGYRSAGKLEGMTALITGGDSGIGRAVAVHYAMEGANVAIVFLDENKDAKDTCKMVEEEGARCLLIQGDIRDPGFCRDAVKRSIKEFGELNILVNNAAEQHPEEDLREISEEIMESTFQTNFFSFFHFTKEALNHMKKGDCIINSTSVTAYRGSHHLIDYSATKGAIVSFTRSLGKNLAKKGIRVNAVAPGPVWTPLIVASFKADEVRKFGQDTPMERAGQPSEIAPAYVFLACQDSSYITGQVIHINGGEVVGS